MIYRHDDIVLNFSSRSCPSALGPMAIFGRNAVPFLSRVEITAESLCLAFAALLWHATQLQRDGLQ